MGEPKKPFACDLSDCNMTFTNEDHLNIHRKKHDMMLQLDSEHKSTFVADQTPTPTRFIRNCEEVGLFQDLQNVNPFDEGFKKAMEGQRCVSLDGNVVPKCEDDVLHTPQMVFPVVQKSGDATCFSSNNQNITISRSSSDESGIVKEYETTTISKHTNEVTIRIVGKDDKNEEDSAQKVNETLSFRNNVITISNIRNGDDCWNTGNSDILKNTSKDVMLIDKLQIPQDPNKIPPIMSQRSLDYVVDNLTLESNTNAVPNSDRTKSDVNVKEDDVFEVVIKLPSGKRVIMKPVEEENPKTKLTKIMLKRAINAKTENKAGNKVDKNTSKPVFSNIKPAPICLPGGTLIPVTILNSVAANIPIVLPQPLPVISNGKKSNVVKNITVRDNNSDNNETDKEELKLRRLMASRRYRERRKIVNNLSKNRIKELQSTNLRLTRENERLRQCMALHLATCAHADDIKECLSPAEEVNNAVSYIVLD